MPDAVVSGRRDLVQQQQLYGVDGCRISRYTKLEGAEICVLSCTAVGAPVFTVASGNNSHVGRLEHISLFVMLKPAHTVRARFLSIDQQQCE